MVPDERRVQTLVPSGNAKPDKRITAIPARARVGQHLAPAERVEDRLRFHLCRVEIVGDDIRSNVACALSLGESRWGCR